MADVAGAVGPAAMGDDNGDDAEYRGGPPGGASPGQEGGEAETRRVSESAKGTSLNTDRGAAEFATGVSATTPSAGVFPAKFSSFPSSAAPAPAPRPLPSLFPSSGNFGAKRTPHGAPSWLSNSSFSERLLPPPPSFSASKVVEHLCGKDVLDEIEKREGKGTERERVRVEPGIETPSSTSDSDVSEGAEGEKSRHKRRKEKRRRKRKKEEKEEERKRRKERKQTGDTLQIGSLEGQSVDRKAAVKAWADGKSNATKEYYVDTRGRRLYSWILFLINHVITNFIYRHDTK